MKPKIALTGVTGTLGKEVALEMKRKGIPFYPLSRQSGFDYEKIDTHKGALDGISQLLLVATTATDGVNKFLENASSLEQIVVISGMSGNVRKDSLLALLEKSVEKRGIFHTTLRLNWFMQNYLTFFRDDIVNRGVIEVPAGESKTSFVDIRDVAQAVVALFEKEEGRGKIYSLTGPEALSWSQVADILSRVSGRKIVYRALSEEEAAQKYGALGWNVEETLLLFREMREGATSVVDKSLERLCGHPARSFETFAKEFSSSWK